MKKIKKLFILCLTFLLVITVASCGGQQSKVPYGNITDATYVSNGKYAVSQKQVYDRLRTKGYSYVTKRINELLISNYMNSVSYSGEDKEELDKIIVSAIFSTTDAETIKNLGTKEVLTYKQKYVDNLFNTYGVSVTVNDINYTVSDDKVEGDFPEKITNLYKYDIASKNFAREKLIEEAKLEKIDNEDNPYYITEEAIKAQYKIMTSYGTRKAIIVRFSSKRNADKAMEYMNSKSINIETDTIAYFIELYNYQYQYGELEKLSINNYLESDEITFVHDEDKNELLAYNTTINSFFEELEDGEYTVVPKNIDDTYTMILRISEDKVYETEKYTDLSATEKTEIDKKIYEILVENKLSTSYINSKIVELLDDATIEIYDPLIEYAYKKNNEDYKYTKNFNSNLIFKITLNSKEYSLSVEEFYNYLNNIYGLEIAIDYLVSKMLVDNSHLVALLDDDAEKTYSDEYKSVVKAFKKSDDKKMGLENYLLTNYGYTTKDDILAYYYKANSLKALAASDLGTVVDNNKNFITTDTIFNIFSEYTKIMYENYFSLEIEHILITIDPNNDGTYDDPKKFMDKLSDNEKRLFKERITSLAYAIVTEAKLISTDTIDALKYIKDAYNMGKPIYSLRDEITGVVPTWDDYKWNYNISLVVESLGTVDNSSAASYVTSFSERVKDLYELLKDDEDFDSDKGYLEHTDKELAELSIDDLTYTNYGYHILNVTNVTSKSSAQFTYEDDTYLDSDDEYKRYQHIKVILDAKDIDDSDDDIIGYANAYSDNAYPSAQQLFIYYYEYISSSGVTSFKSSIETAISKVFDTYISRFNNSNFQTYRLYQSLGTLAFANENFNVKYSQFISIKERDIDGYADTTSPFYYYTGWFNQNWNLE